MIWSLVYFICNVKYYRFLFTLMQISILFLNVLGYEFSKSWKHFMDIRYLLYWINTELIIIMHLRGYYCMHFTFIYLKCLYCNFLHMFMSIYIKLSYIKKEIFYFHHAALYLNGWKLNLVNKYLLVNEKKNSYSNTIFTETLCIQNKSSRG